TIIGYVAAVGVGIVGSSLVLDQITGGWFGYYVWRLPAAHQVASGSYFGFFTTDLIAPLGIAIVIGVVGLIFLRARDSAGFWFHLIVGTALLLASYSARLHTGGYDNVLLPIYAEIAVLFAIGMHRLLELPTRTWLGALAAIACLL